MCTFAIGKEDCSGIYLCVFVHKHFCVCPCHVLECKRVVADFVSELTSESTLGILFVFFSHGSVCDHLCHAQSPGSWLMPCSC